MSVWVEGEIGKPPKSNSLWVEGESGTYCTRCPEVVVVAVVLSGVVPHIYFHLCIQYSQHSTAVVSNSVFIFKKYNGLIHYFKQQWSDSLFRTNMD